MHYPKSTIFESVSARIKARALVPAVLSAVHRALDCHTNVAGVEWELAVSVFARLDAAAFGRFDARKLLDRDRYALPRGGAGPRADNPIAYDEDQFEDAVTARSDTIALDALDRSIAMWVRFLDLSPIDYLAPG